MSIQTPLLIIMRRTNVVNDTSNNYLLSKFLSVKLISKAVSLLKTQYFFKQSAFFCNKVLTSLGLDCVVSSKVQDLLSPGCRRKNENTIKINTKRI